MGTVHLRVMKLKGDCQRCFEPASTVASPYQDGIVEDAAVHSDGSFNIVLRQCRCADYHAVGDVVILAGFSHMPCQLHIIGIKF